MIVISPVRTRSDRREFVNYPYRLYANDPHWIAQPRIMERARFKPANPFLAHADVELFLAREDGRTLGRIAAIDDRLHNERHHDNLATFGHFEAETEEAARALLGAAEDWARQVGRARLRGPLNFSLNESAGLLIDSFDTDPAVMMPYNPPTYVGFIERAGFSKVKDLLAWIIDLPGEASSDRWTRFSERLRARYNLTVRSVNMKAFKQEIVRFVSVYCRAWHNNWGFVEPTDAEVLQLVSELRYIVDTDLVIAAEINGEMVGCGIALPDLNQTFKGTGGRLLPLGPRLLARRRIITQVRILLFGVLPHWHGTGLAVPLMVELLTRAGRRYRRAELSWVLEDNRMTNNGIEVMGGRPYKTYRVYQKEL